LLYKEGDRIYDVVDQRYGVVIKADEKQMLVFISWNDCPDIQFAYSEESLFWEPRWKVCSNRFNEETMELVYCYDE
jgi:hypothetical protein